MNRGHQIALRRDFLPEHHLERLELGDGRASRRAAAGPRPCSAPGRSSEKKLSPSRKSRLYGEGGSFITAW